MDCRGGSRLLAFVLVGTGFLLVGSGFLMDGSGFLLDGSGFLMAGGSQPSSNTGVNVGISSSSSGHLVLHQTQRNMMSNTESSLCLTCVCVWWSPDDGEVTGVLPGDVPGVSQRLPQMILLRRGLLTEEEDTLRLKERSHDRRWEILITVMHYLHTHRYKHMLAKEQCVHIQTDRQTGVSPGPV